MVSTETRAKVKGVLEGIQKRGLPSFVHDLEYTFGTDWTGDPAVRIIVNLKDEAEKLPDLGNQLSKLSFRIRDLVLKKESEAFPYIRYRTLSDKREELQELQANQ